MKLDLQFQLLAEKQPEVRGIIFFGNDEILRWVVIWKLQFQCKYFIVVVRLLLLLDYCCFCLFEATVVVVNLLINIIIIVQKLFENDLIKRFIKLIIISVVKELTHNTTLTMLTNSNYRVNV